MMKRIGLGAAGAAWFVFVFWAVYRLTFPSAAVADRLAWEVQERTDFALSLESSHPWWLGIGGTDVKLASVDRRGNATPLVAADAVRARLGLFGLLTGSARVSGDVTMGEGGVGFYVDASQGERGADIHEIELKADQFPVNAIPPMGGFSLQGRGGFDIDAELDAADGMNKADGHLRLGGKDVIIETIPEAEALLKTFDVLPVVIDDLDIDVEFVGGKGQFEAGRLVTTLGTLELSGTVTLAKRIERSKCAVDLEITLTDAIPPAVKSMLASAKQPNDHYKYEIRGICSRAMPSPVTARKARAPRPRPAKARGAAAKRPRGGAARATKPTAELGKRGPAARATPAGRDLPPADEDIEELEEDDEALEDEELEEELEPADF
ncbi:MAG: type II secretion system protein GspN [Proteobacteria bacterium]|nr:type II secretion system protein GspN [Pseudomonadota bacterium]